MIIHKLNNMQQSTIILVALIGLWCFFLWNAFGADNSFALWNDNEFLL